MPVTITSTDVKVHAGTTASGSQIGSTITTQGSPSTVNLDSTTLGVALQAGHQYCVVARCTNSDGYVSPWTTAYTFKTLIYAEITTLSGGQGTISPELSFSYDHNAISVQSCGVYLSKNQSGANATKYTTDEQGAGQGWVIDNLDENTTYYAIPFVIDNLNREYAGDWAEAESANTGYAAPEVVITNVATTYNTITGNVAISTNDTLRSVTLQIIATGGGSYQYKTLTATTGTQTWSVADGDLDNQGNPITINPSTEYQIKIEAINTGGGSGFAQVVATTQQQTTSTISITGITNITPTSAVATLSYGGGA